LSRRPITDEVLADFERFMMEDNEYVLPCGGGVTRGHYHALTPALIMYGRRHTARLCAHYLMRSGFAKEPDYGMHEEFPDTPERYAESIFYEMAGRGTLRELLALRDRWANGDSSIIPAPTPLAQASCDRLIDWLVAEKTNRFRRLLKRGFHFVKTKLSQRG
ncbi:MAG: hypothetical protein ACOC6C_01585, partial [Verrucomicrobiota bacterium]